MEKKLSREEAWELLTEYIKTPALRKHALAVEATPSAFRGGQALQKQCHPSVQSPYQRKKQQKHHV